MPIFLILGGIILVVNSHLFEGASLVGWVALGLGGFALALPFIVLAFIALLALVGADVKVKNTKRNRRGF